MPVARRDEEGALVVIDEVVSIDTDMSKRRRLEAPQSAKKFRGINSIGFGLDVVERPKGVVVLQRTRDRLSAEHSPEQSCNRVHDLVCRCRRIAQLDEVHDGNLYCRNPTVAPLLMWHARDRADALLLLEPSVQRRTAHPLEGFVARQSRDALSHPLVVSWPSASGVEVRIVSN